MYHVLFLLVMSLTHRWVGRKLAVVLASGMGASLFEGCVCQSVFLFSFWEIGTECLGLIIFISRPPSPHPPKDVKNSCRSFQS